VSRAKKRADRIKTEIPIQQILADYGYRIEAGYSGEQQFSCDLHGDGRDNKPSARVYPHSGSWYCFACDQTRDAISTARDKEGLDFWGALKTLEARYHLPPLPWDDDDREQAKQRQDAKNNGAVAQIAAALDPERTFADDRHVVERLLGGLTADRDLPMKFLLGCWEAFDKITQMIDTDSAHPDQGRVGLAKLRDLVLSKLQERAA
jgi:DNA primase